MGASGWLKGVMGGFRLTEVGQLQGMLLYGVRVEMARGHLQGSLAPEVQTTPPPGGRGPVGTPDDLRRGGLGIPQELCGCLRDGSALERDAISDETNLTKAEHRAQMNDLKNQLRGDDSGPALEQLRRACLSWGLFLS